MKKPITLSIPKPCHEKWSAFTPTSKGGFCSSCQKEVIDFTAWNEDRIARHFSSATATCGRFTRSQLKTYAATQPRRSRWEVFASVFVLTVLSVFWSRPSTAQSRDKQRPTTEQRVPERTAEPATVTGQVSQAEDGSFIPGVYVIRKGTLDGAVTDVEGRFSLTLANPGANEVLVFSFIGLVTQEVPVAGLEANAVMENDTISLGDTLALRAPVDHRVTTGLVGVTVVRRSPALSPRRAWYALKRLFGTATSAVVSESESNGDTCEVKAPDALTDSDNPIAYSPNPVTNKLNVFLPGGSSESLVSINSLQGQLIEERISMKKEEQFNLSDLPAGVYILKVATGDHAQSIKIVKM